MFKVIALVKRTFDSQELEVVRLLLETGVLKLLERNDFLIHFFYSDGDGRKWSERYDIFLEPGTVFINTQDSYCDHYSGEWDSDYDTIDELWIDGIFFILNRFEFKKDLKDRIKVLLLGK